MNTNFPAVTSQDTPELYDPSAFPRPSVTVDVVAFTPRAGKLWVLLVERGVWPFAGSWAVPGGFVRQTEGLDEAARRELCEETSVAAHYLEQLYTFGRVDRDPRTRVITVAYYALLPGPESGLPESAPSEPQAGRCQRRPRQIRLAASAGSQASA